MRAVAAALTLLAAFLSAGRAAAQFSAPPPSDLSDAVQVDEINSPTKALLERAKANSVEKQWDEAIDTLRQVMEHDGGKLIQIDSRRFVAVREYCQMQLAEMPPEGRALYRSRVDALAKRWYDAGLANRDASLLGRVVDQFFVSSWGDAALMALGEIALERGDYQEARWCWERISPGLRAADGQPLRRSLRVGQSAPAEPRNGSGELGAPNEVAAQSPRWLAYPDTKLNLADVRARLVLVSIMEGSLARARVELADFVRRHPEAKGRMAGREARYADTLARLLADAEARPQSPAMKDWTTFAGSPARTAISAEPKSLGNLAWEIPLGDGKPFQADANSLHSWPRNRVAEEQSALLSYHPLVVGNLVLVNNVDKVFAFDLRTGEPAWPVAAQQSPDAPAREPGEIYCGTKVQELQQDLVGDENLFRALGVPRFTMTAAGDRLYARLGSPVTGHPAAAPFGSGSSYLVCLDLAAQGLLVWRVPGDKARNERWAYEGAPVVAGNNVFVVMRYSDVRPQVHVACLDARTGALRWRKLICAAESLAQGQAEEITSNLLTLADDTLYLNTNLGAIAALSATDGEVRWVSTYPRARRTAGEPLRISANCYRDLNPAVYYRGSLFVAPSDAPGIIALDAATGALLWKSNFDLLGPIVHLLGIGADNLIVSGKRICWFDAVTGKVVNYWRDDTTSGYGRGVLVGNEVYWPMRTQIRRCKQQIGDHGELDADEPIELGRFDPPLTGGNLVAANGTLLIATPTKLIALGPGKSATPPAEAILTQANAAPRKNASAP
ncbi:MAG TPA: PQQ-binding-like beta-propeller repeat protein [Pirellulales bacterium]|jgi:outer membrane protein assembly factor BamB|nr:PQQ-binding-like beta-propeller repeat protein [Pirellulales bacterium]